MGKTAGDGKAAGKAGTGKRRRREGVEAREIASALDGQVRVDLSPVTHWLSTGCTILDLAIADRLPGGFAAGRISHVYGPESSAKTVLAQEPLGSAQRQGGEAWFDDAEFTLDGSRAGLFGLNVRKKFHYRNPASIEELFDEHVAAALKGRKLDSPPGAMAVDSLSALPSKTELEEALNKTGYGATRAKQLSRAFRKYIWPLNQANLALIFVDQTRDNITGFGGKYAVSGGKALGFYASTRVLLEGKGQIKNQSGKVVGVKIGFKVTKNKIGPPFRDGTFRLLFERGIDDVATNLQWLRDNTPGLAKEEREGVWYLPGSLFKGQKLGPGLTKAAIKVEQAGMEAPLRNLVLTIWRECYKTDERKPRMRE